MTAPSWRKRGDLPGCGVSANRALPLPLVQVPQGRAVGHGNRLRGQRLLELSAYRAGRSIGSMDP